MTQREYQRQFCEAAMRPLLNIACKEDPWKLGRDFGATNLDLLDYDPHTNVYFKDLPNFIQGSAKALPFGDDSFASAVMGEFIEHCDVDVAKQCVAEASRVLSPGGRLCLTFPLDTRQKEGQHRPELLVEWDGGITSWHRTVWTDEMLVDLFASAGFVEVAGTREHLTYDTWAVGWGITVERAA